MRVIDEYTYIECAILGVRHCGPLQAPLLVGSPAALPPWRVRALTHQATRVPHVKAGRCSLFISMTCVRASRSAQPLRVPGISWCGCVVLVLTQTTSTHDKRSRLAVLQG